MEATQGARGVPLAAPNRNIVPEPTSKKMVKPRRCCSEIAVSEVTPGARLGSLSPHFEHVSPTHVGIFPTYGPLQSGAGLLRDQ